MKKMFIIIAILATIFVGMIIYKKTAVGAKDNINIQEIEKIEEYISKIYMWQEVTNEALPVFEDINQAPEIWIWEVINQNLENYEITYEEIEQTAKNIFGQEFAKTFPKEGSETIKYNEETQMYYTTGMGLDEDSDTFLLNDIKKTKEGYEVEIVEYLENYSEEQSVIIKNLDNEEIGRVGINDSETKMQEIVKANIDRFSKKKIYLKSEKDTLIVQKVENK